jgi:hypothetical protein
MALTPVRRQKQRPTRSNVLFFPGFNQRCKGSFAPGIRIARDTGDIFQKLDKNGLFVSNESLAVTS